MKTKTKTSSKKQKEERTNLNGTQHGRLEGEIERKKKAKQNYYLELSGDLSKSDAGR